MAIHTSKKKYGIIPGVTDREYYTNSFHVPVYYKIDAFEKIKIEDVQKTSDWAIKQLYLLKYNSKLINAIKGTKK